MSKIKAIPEGLHTVTPQLTVDGAADAIAFYQRAFGAEEIARAPDPSGKKIWHAELALGDSRLYLNDAFPGMGAPANKTRLWVYSEAVDALFKRAVDAGASVKMPLADMFWGDRLGTVVDPWGNEWSLAQRVRVMTREEMKQAQDAFVAQSRK
jgi:PhnB protein